MSSAFLLTDPGWLVERTLVAELTCDGTQSRLQSKVLEACPKSSDICSAEVLALRFNRIAGTELQKMSSRGSQEKFKVARQLIAAIVEERPPVLGAARECDFLCQVVSSFQWLVTFGAGSADAGEILYGAKAVEAIFQSCKEKYGRGEAAPNDIHPLKVFWWLLDAKHQQEVDAMTKDIAARTKTTLLAASSGKTKGKAKDGDKAADAALNKALDMFK